MTPDFPLTRDLVLIGGGHTHALILRKWGMHPLVGVRVTVINPGPTAPYSGMLPGFVAGHYTREELDIDLVQLAQFANARLINGAVTEIDRSSKTITVPGRPPIAYDVASVDVGITSAMPNLPGFAENAVPAKPLGKFATRWTQFCKAAQAPHIAIIGGGVAGAELSMAMAYALRDCAPQVQLIDRGDVLSDLGATAQRKMLVTLAAKGVKLIENAEVTEIGADHVKLGDGRTVRSDFTVGAAGAKPHGWMANIGVEMHEGFIAVGAYLQSSDPAIFAVGDCAHLTHAPRTKAGVYAVREAPILFDNLRAVLSGGTLQRYHPQKDYLKLISQGGKVALAERFGTALSGALLWRWKDQIDRKFMRQFTDLPVMPVPELPVTHALGLQEALGDKPMCGGCGAKVGRGALLDIVGPGDDAGVLKTGEVTQVISTDHLRTFVDDPVVMARIAAVHALGDIWAMGARPQAATLNLILPRMSSELQRRTLAEIHWGAGSVLQEADCRIVGGHTSLGSELTIGLTVTGICDTGPITLAGARPGDALLLTKPLGSGVMMAAAMAMQANGADVIAALELMQQGQGEASAILSDATAMTDVTGFGLAGHLAGMCAASDVAAKITLDHIPIMSGAFELARAGIRSSLFTDNVNGAGEVLGPAGAAFDLLFDPQTAGGLLAAVPNGNADAIVCALRNAGYPAARIGEICEGAPAITAS